MSRKLWVWFSHCFEGVHREVALQRPLLTAPQGYLRRQRARTHLVREDPHHPRPPLDLLKQALQHVRCAYPSVVRSWIAQVAQGIIDPGLKLGLTRLRGPIRVKRSGSVKGVEDGQDRQAVFA